MLKNVIPILSIVLTILQIVNLSIDILEKISNRAANVVTYNLVKL